MTDGIGPEEQQWIAEARKAMLSALQTTWDTRADSASREDFAPVALSAAVSVMADLIVAVTTGNPDFVDAVIEATIERLPYAVAEKQEAWAEIAKELENGPALRN